MSLGAGFRSIYDEIKNLRVKSKDNQQSMPNINRPQQQHIIRRTLSRDRSSTWRDVRCCCQQRVNEIEKTRRKIMDENSELRRLCIYLDDQRQQALNELNQWRNGRQTGSCWYSDPCCGSNCEFRCPINQTNAPNQSTNSPVQQQPNDELLNYVRSLENRILTLEEGKTTIHRDGVILGRTRRPIRSVSQQHSPMNSTSTTRDFTLQAINNPAQQQIHTMDSSQSTLTDSGSTFYSDELDEDEQDEDSAENSAATTVFVQAKRASNNLSNFTKQLLLQQSEQQERSASSLVKKFLSNRQTFLQALKKRNDLTNVGNDFEYAIIQRKNKNTEWSESSDLPPSLPELMMKRKFTSDKPMNNGVQLTRQVAA